MTVQASVGTRVFRTLLAFYIAIAIARIAEIVPYLASLHLAKLLTLLMVIAALVALPRWQLLFALRNTTTKAILIILVVSAIAVPFSIWPSNSAIYVSGPLLPGIVLFLLVSAGFADRNTARVCIVALVLAVAVDAAYVLVGPAPQKLGRPYISESLDPNESAALFVAAFPFAMMLAHQRRALRRWLGLPIALLLALAIVRTGSRGGVLGLVVVAGVLIYRAQSRRRWLYIIAIGACAGAIALAGDQSSLSRVRTLLAPKSDYNYTSSEGRLQIWGRGIQYMLKRPLLGVGLGNFETAEGVLSEKAKQRSGVLYTAPHNAFIQVGAELGVIGLVAFVVAVFSAARGSRRIQRLASRDRLGDVGIAEQETNLATAAYTALLGVITTALFLSIAYNGLTLFVLGVCVGVQVGSPYAAQRRAQLGGAAFNTRAHSTTRLTAVASGVALQRRPAGSG